MKLSEIIEATHTYTSSNASDKLTYEDVEKAIKGLKNPDPFVLHFKARKKDIKSFAVYFGVLRMNFYASIPVIEDSTIPKGHFRAVLSDGTHKDLKIYK